MKRRSALLLLLSVGACSPEPTTTETSTTTSAPVSSASAGAGSASASAGLASPGPRTPNELYARGTPTFIAGTLGDEHEDRVIRGQIEMIRGMLFPTAKVVDDTSIDVTRGAEAWPPNAVLYGGPQHNAVLRALASELPFRMASDSFEIDGHTLKGSGIQLITLVPARADTLAHPSFMLYAGTGSEGVAEINGMPHGESEIAIYDAFDSVAAGSWQRSQTGFTPQLNWAPKRGTLDDEEDTYASQPFSVKITTTTLRGASYDRLETKRAAVKRGVVTAMKQLAPSTLAAEMPRPAEVRVVIYPNAEAKKTFTHSAGNGHAAPAARTLHVVAFDEKPLELLVAHEATHVFTSQLWGPPGTAFMGEGLAVWVSGQYGGTELARWKTKLRSRTPLATLLGVAFRRTSEGESYPQAGLVIDALIRSFGLPKVRRELWAATPDNWQAACERLGISFDEIEKASR